MTSGPEFWIKALITVKAYPNPSKKSGESVCVAGVVLEPEPVRFVRLYPVDHRGLPRSQRFSKYDVVRCLVRRPTHDARPESLCPILETIERVGHMPRWEDGARILEPLCAQSMCEIYERQRTDGTSLGLFRPAAIDDLIFEEADPWDAGRLATVHQANLLEITKPRRPLEQIPYKFCFVYRCEDPGCRGHTMSTIDWEAGAHFRKTRGRPLDERLEFVRQRWLKQVCGPTRDPHFFVGSLAKHYTRFVVLGVFRPLAARQLELTAA